MVEWRDISGFPSYQVNRNGEVRRKLRDPLARRGEWKAVNSFRRKADGYHYFVFQKDKTPHARLAHRVVATAFCERVGDRNQVNHIDGNKSNNRADNLEWVTPKENQQHAARLGLTAKGERSGQRKLDSAKVIEIKRSEQPSSVLARRFGVSKTTIKNVRKGKVWAHVG